MLHYKYLIIGGGMAADAAARGIRLGYEAVGELDSRHEMIAEPGPFRAEDLEGRLPETH